MWPLRSGRDPSPSRLAYRLHRLWLTPFMRALVRIGLPAAAIAVPVAMHVVDADNRAAMAAQAAELRRAIEERPEFMVDDLRIEGADRAVGNALKAAVAVELPASSFHLDPEALRAQFEAFDVVRSADLRITSDRELSVTIRQRQPALVWRDRAGLFLVDPEGHAIARLDSRTERADLPLIAGDGAADHAAEALELFAASEPLTERLRGLVRVGERRWDVMLDRDQRIRLPAEDPVRALERAIAADRARDLLARDVTDLDLRLPEQATVRLTANAHDHMRQMRRLNSGESN